MGVTVMQRPMRCQWKHLVFPVGDLEMKIAMSGGTQMYGL